MKQTEQQMQACLSTT